MKTGNGAFMKTLEGSIELAQAMVNIGWHNGRKVAALILNMDTPLAITSATAWRSLSRCRY